MPQLRPASVATLPPGIQWEYTEMPWDLAHRRPELPRSGYRYGVIATSRPLTADEIERFSLRFIGTIPRKAVPTATNSQQHDLSAVQPGPSA